MNDLQVRIREQLEVLSALYLRLAQRNICSFLVDLEVLERLVWEFSLLDLELSILTLLKLSLNLFCQFIYNRILKSLGEVTIKDFFDFTFEIFALSSVIDEGFYKADAVDDRVDGPPHVMNHHVQEYFVALQFLPQLLDVFKTISVNSLEIKLVDWLSIDE